MSSFWSNATVHSYNTSESSNATFSLYNKACNVFDNSFSVKIGLILVFSTIMLFSRLVCIAVDRFVAVVFPMKAHLVSSRLRTTVIAAIWILALMLTDSLDLYAFELVQLSNGDTICTYVNDSILSFRMYYLVYSGIFAIGPLMTITILY